MQFVHFFTHLQTLGGVESLLRLHMSRDIEAGIESMGVYACEGMDINLRAESVNTHGLGIRGWHSFHNLAEKLIRHTDKAQAVIFHNLWGFRHLEGHLPESILKIGMLHVDGPVSRKAMEKCASRLDHVICVSDVLAEYSRQFLPEECVSTIAYPILPPLKLTGLPRRMAIGYCGRLVREQKRVERLPKIASKILQYCPRCTFEICGEGPERRFLEAEMPKDTVFHGRLSGIQYWNTLASWHAILFCSDYEGTPISLLEALSQGTLPIYPEINSGGEEYVRTVSDRLLYRPKDIDDPLRVFSWLEALKPAQIEELREKAAAAVARNTPDSYLQAVSKILASVKNRSGKASKKKRVLLQYVPLGVLRRLNASTVY